MSQDITKPMTPIDKMLAELGVFTVHDQRLEERNRKLAAQYQEISKPLDVELYRMRWYNELRRKETQKNNPKIKMKPGKKQKAQDKSEVPEILSPMGVILLMEQRTYQFDSMLREVSIPWGRAADTSWYAEAIRAWERLLSKAGFGMIDGVKTILSNKNTLMEWDVVKKLEGWLQVEVFAYAKMIMDVSWRDRDVSPSFSLTLNRPPAPTDGAPGRLGGAPFITSLERESDRSGNFQFPATLDTRVQRKDGRG